MTGGRIGPATGRLARRSGRHPHAGERGIGFSLVCWTPDPPPAIIDKRLAALVRAGSALLGLGTAIQERQIMLVARSILLSGLKLAPVLVLALGMFAAAQDKSAT